MCVSGGVSGVEEDAFTPGNIEQSEYFAEFFRCMAYATVGSRRDAADLGFVVKPGKLKGFTLPDEVAGLNTEGAEGAAWKGFPAGQGDLN